MVGPETAPVVGLKVRSTPTTETAVHCEVDGHATAVRLPEAPRLTGVGVPPVPGSNVTRRMRLSTAVHCEVDGQAIPVKNTPTFGLGGVSTRRAVGLPGDVGSKVTARPASST